MAVNTLMTSRVQMRQCVTDIQEAVNEITKLLPRAVQEKTAPAMRRLSLATLRATEVLVRQQLAAQEISYSLVGASRKRPVSVLDDPASTVFRQVATTKRPAAAAAKPKGKGGGGGAARGRARTAAAATSGK